MGCYGEGPITDGDKVGPALKRALVGTVTQFR
jgi:hypothetical protein